jgi:mRNA interferase MazF
MKGSVVLVPFPFDDLSGAKVRPAVCLTEAITAHRHVVIAYLSSVVPTIVLPSDLVLDPMDPDFRRTGLQVRSVLRLHRLATVRTRLFIRMLGELSDGQLQQVESRLRRVLSL